MWVSQLVSEVSRWGILRKAGMGKEKLEKRLDKVEWEEVAEGMTGFGWSGRGEWTPSLFHLQVAGPVDPCSSPCPSHALSCGGSHVIVCLLFMHSAFLGLGPLRVCEDLFSLLSSLSGKCRALFIPQRRSELLDPLGPCHCAPFCSLLHVSPSLPACSELLVGLCRDLDSTPDLNI